MLPFDDEPLFPENEVKRLVVVRGKPLWPPVDRDARDDMVIMPIADTIMGLT